ncbi:hypothetical protein BJV82DRAFT_358945 [Fennellomyces sp. T-0311]|nr:hypothetical protein BJV82DRAFT_358945 [Fennellomyces sp. T-0311]
MNCKWMLTYYIPSAINHIFYFSKNKGRGVWRVLEDENHDAIEVDLERTAGLQILPFEAVEKCRNLLVVAQENETELRTMLLHYQLETKSDKIMMPFIRCVDQLNTNYENVNDFYDLEEIRFFEGPSRSSKACKEAFEGVDSSMVALKPDVIISKGQSEYVAGEVKKPDYKYFGVYTDLPKLGFELKYMLDHLITANPCKEDFGAPLSRWI